MDPDPLRPQSYFFEATDYPITSRRSLRHATTRVSGPPARKAPLGSTSTPASTPARKRALDNSLGAQDPSKRYKSANNVSHNQVGFSLLHPATGRARTNPEFPPLQKPTLCPIAMAVSTNSFPDNHLPPLRRNLHDPMAFARSGAKPVEVRNSLRDPFRYQSLRGQEFHSFGWQKYVVKDSIVLAGKS